MEPTRRAWIVLAVASAGATLLAVFSNRLFIGLPIGAGTWLLAHQFAFARSIKQIRRANPAILYQSLSDENVLAGESTTLTVRFSAETETVTKPEAALEVNLPPGVVTDESRICRVPAADTPEFEVSVRAPVAGTFEIRSPSIHLSSSHGLFHETLRVGNECSLFVEPRVQNAESGTSCQTHVFIDQRVSMRDGQPGQTKLDYAREIGLVLTAQAADNKVPIRVSFVDDASDGETVASGLNQYRRVRQRLHEIEPDDDTPSRDATPPVETTRIERSDPLRVRRDAVRRATTLDGDDIFAQTLAPYFETMATYSTQMANKPLFNRVTASVQHHDADSRFVVITDDVHREETLGIARFASVYDVELSVFVLPSPVFTRRDAVTLTAVNERSRDGQSFIDTLNENDNVKASETGPHKRPAVGSTSPTQGADQ